MALKRLADGPSSRNKRRKGEDVEPIATSAATYAASETTTEKQIAHNATDTNSVVVQKKEKASLLGLPPELRNKIYDSQVCSLHAAKPDAKQNGFTFIIRNCDVKGLYKFQNVFDRGFNIQFQLAKEPHWLNLLRWCRWIYMTKQTPTNMSLRRPCTFQSFVWAIIRQAQTSKAATWTELMADLNRWRPVAGGLDPAWLIEHS
ncbi:hypothetical protein CKM354_000254600 [Cercospora kikuchii]|uniref:Uncharacterized protein n=1 Tax=Cercospora kikuchii TaxID=84275 RepID=A0A9P3CEY9_9PEZI|nr:uncharacterized protein CKM354_000254600 [Cercospora kikuchii]GIZ39155.1 hypothetical protein CKM354_000254600 [Cercospora kikuchii]